MAERLPAMVWLNPECPAQEAVRDLEAVTRQRDELAARLAEARAAGCRAGRYGAAAREEVEKLRREACEHNAALCNARGTIAGLEAQVSTLRAPPRTTHSPALNLQNIDSMHHGSHEPVIGPRVISWQPPQPPFTECRGVKSDWSSTSRVQNGACTCCYGV